MTSLPPEAVLPSHASAVWTMIAPCERASTFRGLSGRDMGCLFLGRSGDQHRFPFSSVVSEAKAKATLHYIYQRDFGLSWPANFRRTTVGCPKFLEGIRRFHTKCPHPFPPNLLLCLADRRAISGFCHGTGDAQRGRSCLDGNNPRRD